MKKYRVRENSILEYTLITLGASLMWVALGFYTAWCYGII